MANGEAPFSSDNPQRVTFQSWGAFVAYVATTTPTVAGGLSSHDPASSWNGNVSWARSLALAVEGWTEGEQRIRELSRRLEAHITHRIVREEFNYDVEGMAFDVARFLNGEPEHWIRPEEATVTTDHGSKHVKLVVNISASSAVSPEAIIARGAAVAALVELLEYADHRVEVWITNPSSAAHRYGEAYAPPIYVCDVKVKSFDQPLDMGLLAFALAHPATLRRLMFAAQECADPSIVKYVTHSNSYGYPTENDAAKAEAGIYLPGSKLWDSAADWTSPESVETWILAELAKQGIVLRDA